VILEQAAAVLPGAPVMAAPQFGADAANDLGGARAIEIAAMLGDSVVGVKHVMNPRGGKVTSKTYGIFAAGVVLLFIAAFAFFTGVGVAARNEEAQQQWTEVERKPLYDFRPEMMGLAYDWMAFGGVCGGLVLLIMGLARYRGERLEPFFRIGNAGGVDFPTDDAPSPSFPLIGPLGDDFVLNFASPMEGEMMLDGQSVPLADLANQGRARSSQAVPGAMEVSVPAKARFRVTSGTQTFLVSSVPQPRKHVVPLFSTLETEVLAYLGGTALVVFLLVALMDQINPERFGLSTEFLGVDGRLSRVEFKPQDDPKNEEEEMDTGKDDDRSGGTGTKMALEEGKMGKKDSTRQSGEYAMKNNDADPQLARQQALDQARTSGILGAFNSTPGGAFASLTGTADFSSGIDDQDVYGGLIGNEVGEMQGGWGYSLAGTGPGGGGTGWGTIGTGRYGTIGHGSGTGSGYGSVSGRDGMRGRKVRPPPVRIGNATKVGDLDRNIIRRYIRRKLRRIQNCYERQLLVKSTLSGTVVTVFQISPQGKVQGAKASGMGDSVVEGCVAEAIRSIQFPKPRGGGFVHVRYPFHFHSGG